METSARSNIGIMLMDQIAAIDSDANAGNNIIRVLTSTSSVLSSSMLRQILDCIRLLGTTYAFMVPYDLSALLNRVDLFDGYGASLRSSVNEATMVCPHDGYNVKGERLRESRYMKALAITVGLGNKTLDA